MNPFYNSWVLVLENPQGQCKTVPDSLLLQAMGACLYLLSAQYNPDSWGSLPSLELESRFSGAVSLSKHSGPWEYRSCQPLGKDLRFPLSWCHNLLYLPRFCFPIQTSLPWQTKVAWNRWLPTTSMWTWLQLRWQSVCVASHPPLQYGVNVFV